MTTEATPELNPHGRHFDYTTAAGETYRFPLVTFGPYGRELDQVIKNLADETNPTDAPAFMLFALSRYYSQTTAESLLDHFSYQDVEAILNQAVGGLTGE